MTAFNFGSAIGLMKDGKKVYREGWNGKGLFVFMQVPATIPISVVPNMQSLPQSVKDEFVKRGLPISYSNQIALVTPDNQIQGWSPSTPDALAEDWKLFE